MRHLLILQHICLERLTVAKEVARAYAVRHILMLDELRLALRPRGRVLVEGVASVGDSGFERREFVGFAHDYPCHVLPALPVCRSAEEVDGLAVLRDLGSHHQDEGRPLCLGQFIVRVADLYCDCFHKIRFV